MPAGPAINSFYKRIKNPILKKDGVKIVVDSTGGPGATTTGAPSSSTQPQPQQELNGNPIRGLTKTQTITKAKSSKST
jgi:hypothetical protein